MREEVFAEFDLVEEVFLGGEGEGFEGGLGGGHCGCGIGICCGG